MLHYKYKTLHIPRCRYLGSFVIPLGSICALSLSILFTSHCSAATTNPTASLSIADSTLSTTIKPGEVAYLSSNITINTTDTENYTISIIGPTGLNGNATMTGAGNNTPTNMPNNSWGYAYNQSATNSKKTYSSFTGSPQTLETGTTANNLTKDITFAAKFGDNAEAGHYTANVTLSLVATPKKLLGLENATYMQDLNGHPEYCTETPLLDGKTYSAEYTLIDNRTYPSSVSKTYTVRRFGDNRCWMTQNLRIYNTTIHAADSDFTSGSITLPTSTLLDFPIDNSNTYSFQSYLASDAESSAGIAGYYNWYTATAGAGIQSFASGAVHTSICPKGWTLPSGGSNASATEYGKLVNSESIPIKSVSGVSKITASPYNFQPGGYVENAMDSLQSTDFGYWWTNMAYTTSYSNSLAYTLVVGSNYIAPGNGIDAYRYTGRTVRCIARK